VVLPESKQLLTLLLDGDGDTIDWLRRRCNQVAAPQFSAWAWNWIQEDFASDLIAQLVSAAGSDSFELRGDANAYVDTAIRNLCRRYFQEMARLRSQTRIDRAGDLALGDGTRDAMAGILAAIEIRRALGELSPACLDLIKRKYVEGQSLQGIGAAMGIPEKTVRSRLHSCRQRLRACWKKLST
jgi:RNA polymerase sigma factor (sigma-70 family)